MKLYSCFLSSNTNFPRSVVFTFFVKANLFLRVWGIPARKNSWDDIERKSIMLNMGGSCSVKNKRNMEFNPVKESISLSLYRGIFKTLKNGLSIRTVSSPAALSNQKRQKKNRKGFVTFTVMGNTNSVVWRLYFYLHGGKYRCTGRDFFNWLPAIP